MSESASEPTYSNITPLYPDRDKASLEAATLIPPDPVDGGGGPPHSPDMTDLTARLEKVEKAVSGLERTVDGLSKEVSYIKWYAGLLGAVVIAGFAFLGQQLLGVSAGVSGLRTDIQAEFRALRAETSADRTQTSAEFRALRAEAAADRTQAISTMNAIASGITAAKQTPPQVILVPTPEQAKPTP